MKVVANVKRMLRGEVSPRAAAREARLRVQKSFNERRERAQLGQLDGLPARLRHEFARMSGDELLSHFRFRTSPKFFPGFSSPYITREIQPKLFPKETSELIAAAERISAQHCWQLMGFGEKCFGAEEVDWHLDPLSGCNWPLDFHADLNLMRNDGSDARVVWEVNRLGHLITLGRAFVITDDEELCSEFCRQLISWRAQNPLGRGVNWKCAMEVALRAMNLLAAWSLFSTAPELNEEILRLLLTMLDQHGAHIKRNLEFSYIATSNHYLTDVTGLLWIGLMLPELQSANAWREFAVRELLQEMDKQVLADGADYEASTGYHRLTLELFLFSFVLCHLNGVDIPERYWTKLRAMLNYVRAYLRPDGRAPLIGDSDSGQVLPVVRRSADDHAYVLALGAAVFREPRFKLNELPPPELLWILGEQGLNDYQSLPLGAAPASQAFPDAGVCILRDNDLYLLFNASASGVNGRGSHGHNDALSIEVSACGTAFIVDPGSYVYTADLRERQLFRSTAYHSTVEIDGLEQNTTNESIPFVIGNEAQPRIMSCKKELVAEHFGYQRLAESVTHRRSIQFEQQSRYWSIEDNLSGAGTHQISFRFHFAPGLEVKVRDDRVIEAHSQISGARLFVIARDLKAQPVLESRFSSNDYGAKSPSTSVCWSVRSRLPYTAGFEIVPVCAKEDEGQRLALLKRPQIDGA